MFCLAGRAADNRPNILFIMADDHAWQAVSAYGEGRRLLQTPNIDRLGAEGMRFDHCLVCNSLCGPSRAAIITGAYSHINGFYNNGNCRFDGSQITYPKLLQQAGYQTAVIGKWHLETDPTGFDYWNILPGQGIYYNPVLLDQGRRVKHPGYVTDVITDLSLDWLKHRDPSKPFMLLCWQKAPHRIWEPALRDLDFDHDRVYPQPPSLFDDYSGRGLAEHDQNMTIAKTMKLNEDNKLTDPPEMNADQRKTWDAYYAPRNKKFAEAQLSGQALTEWKYNRFMHDYLGCIKGVDDSVGRILKYLDDTGLASNTIVLYASDQGFFLGEHGWFDKRWIFQESARTPLLIRWPGMIRPGSVNKDLVSNMDLAETFLEAAGLPIPGRMQGRSLMPIFRGETPPDWRTAFYYHYYEYPADHHVRPHYGVITDRFTLAHFYWPDVDYWELFDREKDPGEMRSVFGDPAYADTQSKLMAEVARLRTELKEPAHDDPKAYGNQPKTK
ncbi:MAG TPA: sulfatase [Verrucomicrobiae bacterium]|jgi:arylsulfatase A-like enzyme